MRVIFHDMQMSTSLLEHLRLKDTAMLSSAPGHDDVIDYLAAVIDINSAPPTTTKPLLGS